MGNLKKCFDNSFYRVAGKNNITMVKISWRDNYKRIDDGEEIKDNRYRKTNLYVDSA